jgi:hypothetical protein
MRITNVSPTILSNIQDRIEPQISEIANYPFDGLSILNVEKKFFQNIGKGGAAGIAELFIQNDENRKSIIRYGQKHYLKFNSTGKYLTLLGEVQVKRGIYQSNKENRSICPLEERLKFINNYVSFAAAEYICYSLASMTIREFVEHCRKWAFIKPSVATVKKVLDYMGHFIETNGIPDEVTTNETVTLNAVTLSISIDSTCINIVDEGWKHATAATVSTYDAAGKRLDTVYIGCMPEKGKRTIKSLLEKEVSQKLAQHQFQYVVCIADGAREFWRYFNKKYSSAIHVVDFFHVSEHLAKLSHLLFSNQTLANEWFNKYRSILKNNPDGAAKVIRAVRYRRGLIKKNNEVESELKYLQHNKKRMNYYELKQQHLPIGSGVIEAACKNLIGARLKKSGMRWTYQGGQTVLTLRSFVLSKRWEAFWNFFLKTHFPKMVT